MLLYAKTSSLLFGYSEGSRFFKSREVEGGRISRSMKWKNKQG